MPNCVQNHYVASAPTDTAEITYTEIPTLADDQFAPSAFTGLAITQDENTTINTQLHPQGAPYTTTVDETTLPRYHVY